MKKRFTLIELLVVISIISVLVDMLLPALNTARQAARKIGCTNNLKTMGHAILMYTETYKNTLPAGALPISGSNETIFWFDALSEYGTTKVNRFKTSGTFVCPEEPSKFGWNYSNTPPEYAYTHYLANQLIMGHSVTGFFPLMTVISHLADNTNYRI